MKLVNDSHKKEEKEVQTLAAIKVVLGDSEATFLREKEDTALCPSHYCILVIYSVVKLKKSSNTFVFHTS